MIKAVLFDMDGVLVDTEWFYNRRRCAYLETKGFVFDEIPDLSGTNDIYVWEYFEPDDAQRRAELKREYVEVYMKEHPVPYDELKNPDAKPVMGPCESGACECHRELRGEAHHRGARRQRPICATVLQQATVSGHEVSAFKPDPRCTCERWNLGCVARGVPGC